MATYELCKRRVGDAPILHKVNGRKVSRDRYDEICIRARMSGHHECFHTVTRTRKDGVVIVNQYSVARW